MRSDLNFGVVYGIGAQRFSHDDGIECVGSGRCFASLLCDLSRLDTYLRESANRAVSDKAGAHRYQAGWYISITIRHDRQQISMTQRNGKNAPIQGTSADILKRALRLLNDELRETTAKIVNIIHDEIVVEVDEDEAAKVAQTVERAMCAAGEEYLKTVPVKVEIADCG